MTLVVRSSPTCKPVVVFSDPFFSQILPFSPHRQSSCFGSSVWWGLSRDSVLETDPGPCQSLAPGHLHPPTAQYSGSSSLQGFVLSGGKCPKFLVLNMTLHPTASAVLPAREELGLPRVLFLSLKTDCVSQTLVCGLSPHSRPANGVAEFCLSFYRRG